MDSFYKLDSNSWKEIALPYCGWAEGTFDFDYCDVVVQRLEQIFFLGDIETKAYAAAAAAELGASHDRWFVMRRVLGLCGPRIESSVAKRIAIEIFAREFQRQFRRCADGVGANYSAYHPIIAEALSTAESRS